MKKAFLSVVLVAGAVAASAQAPSKPAAPSLKPVAPKAAVAVKPAAPAAAPGAKAVVARPAGVAKGVAVKPAGASKAGPPVVVGVAKELFALKYIDLKVGTGAEAEPNKMYKVHYTGWLGSDGTKFDSSLDHRMPVMGEDGKPVLGADGQPKMGEAEPFSFPQGFGRVIPGWDLGFSGMKIGGKRRLLIPWQLAYGAAGRPPVIPAKSDLVFDLELIGVSDLPAAQPRPAVAAPAAKPAATAPASAPAAAKPAEPAAGQPK